VDTIDKTARSRRKESDMSAGKVAIAILALCLAIGGGVAALAETGEDRAVEAIDLDDGVLRKDDAADEIAGVEDDDDDDGTRGGNATNGGDNTRESAEIVGNDGTNGGDNTGDGDATGGNDGTNGGDNTRDVTYDTEAGSDTAGGATT
jgi:hypothetical protein